MKRIIDFIKKLIQMDIEETERYLKEIRER